LRRAWLILLVLAAAGCGGDDEGSTPAAATATPTPSAAPGEQLPERPQVDVKGADLPAFRAGRAAAPEAVTGPASVVGTIRRPERLAGRAGVFCRGYELTIDRRGRARVERTGGESVVEFDARVDAAEPPGTPVPVVLLCGPGEREGEVVVGFSVGARPLAYARHEGPLTGDSAGLLAPQRADQRRFAQLQLYLAE
jgi:hypothetical protein